MKITIDNHDGKGAVDYSGCIVSGQTAEHPCRIVRRLNEPVTFTATLLPAQGMAMPARNARVIVSDDGGTLLFTGYICTEPALQLAGEASSGAVYVAVISAISDDILLSRQPLPQAGALYGATAAQGLQSLLDRMQMAGITRDLNAATLSISQFLLESGRTWAENAGALANATRNAWRLMNGTVSMAPVGSVTHTLDETQGTLSLNNLQLSMTRALANDVAVCGEIEPCAYVTEFFEGDGTTVLFNLAEEPWVPSAAQQKPLMDLFQGPSIDKQLWYVSDPGACLSITGNGLTCAGGDTYGSVTLSAISNLELGGCSLIEAAGVQFGAQTTGILNGLYNSDQTDLADCMVGFQLTQPGGVTTIGPLINGTPAGSLFTPAAGHSYTLRLRLYTNEVQRVLQSYYTPAEPSGYLRFGATFVNAGATAVLEVQDTTNGVAGAPVVLYSGWIAVTPPWCLFAPLNAAFLDCSIASIVVEQTGPVWVTSTPASGTAVVRRIGTAAQGGDCALLSGGRLQFYPASTPQAGEVIAVSYRTGRRAVARLASMASIAAESQGGALPGTARWMGTVTSPAARSSADCENAANAMLTLATSRAAAWSGRYTAWNLEQQADVWPGDVLAVASASAGVTANLIVRTVEIDLASTAPGLTKYTIGFANDWADELSIRATSAVPADAWLPQQPETTTPLANLNTLAVTSVSGSAIDVAAGVTPPAGGGFEVRRRDWAFTPGPGPDLVLRSAAPNFTIPRQAVTERYFIRMYDGSTPPNYSRFSTAVFVNLPL